MNIDLDYLSSLFEFNYLRYIFGAGLIYVILVLILSRIHPYTRVNPDLLPTRKTILREIAWSTSSVIVFCVGTYLIIYYLAKPGYSLLYEDIGTYGYVYYFFSIIFCVFLHDLTFYISHRLLHTHFMMKHFHRIHHSFKNPTPFAIWAAHPLEATILLLIAFLPIFLIPMHITALVIYMLITQIFNLLGHAGVEIMPHKLNTKKLLKYVNTPTHHNMHHRYTNYSFGIYSRIWDTLFRTNHPRYEEEFLKHAPTRRSKAPNVAADIASSSRRPATIKLH